MESLKENWLTDGLIDFEYKKYILLAYLQDVRRNFDDNKLYPFLSDLVFHYRNLQVIKQKKELLMEQFPKMVSKADFKKLQVTYKKIVEDDDLMEVIESIANFALDKFKGGLEHGREIYDFIENKVEIIPIGLSPLYINEGYMLISENSHKEIRIFKYLITIFEDSKETFRGVSTEYLFSLLKSLNSTYENIKLELIRRDRSLPNPATYLITSKITVPFEETLFPIAKRLLVKYVSAA